MSTTRTLGHVATTALVVAALAGRPARAQAADTPASRTMLAQHHRDASRGDSAAARAAGASPRDGSARAGNAMMRHAPRNAGMYGLMLSAGVLYNLACPLGTMCDRDTGGYVDSFGTIDKVAHASTAAALTSFAIGGGVQPEAAAVLTFAAGVGFELTQTQGGGYYSARDVAANATGIALAWGWHRLAMWRRSR